MIDMKMSNELTTPGGSILGGTHENNASVYPYGLRITLDNDTLRKMAMDLPGVGDMFQLSAMVEVIAVRKGENLIEDDRHVELQIQTMMLDAPEDERNEQQQSYDKVAGFYSGD